MVQSKVKRVESVPFTPELKRAKLCFFKKKRAVVRAWVLGSGECETVLEGVKRQIGGAARQGHRTLIRPL